jgi:hypothetical protein
MLGTNFHLYHHKFSINIYKGGIIFKIFKLIYINIHYPRLLMTHICHFLELHGTYIMIIMQCALNNYILLAA